MNFPSAFKNSPFGEDWQKRPVIKTIGPGDPVTGIINAHFVFVNQLGNSDAQVAQFNVYKAYFISNITQMYGPSAPVIINNRNVTIRTNFIIDQDQSTSPKEIPLGTYYIEVRDGGGRSCVTPPRPVASMNIADSLANVRNPTVFANNVAAHETGHLFGLSDRYHYFGYMKNPVGKPPTVEPGTQNIPMNLLPGVDPNYTKTKNLMSSIGNEITPMQWGIIFGKDREEAYPVATFYIQQNNMEKVQRAIIEQSVFLGMNLYSLVNVQNKEIKGNEIVNAIPSFFILNGGTIVLNLYINVLVKNSISMSGHLWENTPNQTIIKTSQL